LVLVVALAGPLLGLFKIDTYGLIFIVGGLAMFFYPMIQALYFRAVAVVLVLIGLLLWMDVISISGAGGF